MAQVGNKHTQAHPDADLFPHATGEALKTVEAHGSEQPLKLYAGWFCPFVQRTWLVLEEKQIPYQYIEVNPYDKPDSLIKLNRRGLVPTLEHDGKPLFESGVINEFLEDAYADRAPALRSEDPHERARQRIWADFVSTRIIPAFHRFLQFQEGSHEGTLDQKRQEFLQTLREWVGEMHPEGPYFGGSRPMLVDFQLAPWAMRLWIFDHFKGGLGVPEEGSGGEHEQTWARWRKWVRAIENRRSIAVTTSEKEHLLPIYQRYADDKAQSELAKATRQGRGVP